MVISVEISSINQRYKHCRLGDAPSEKRLLSSVATDGIREPLLGVMVMDAPILLDGFKRLRCAKKLGVNQIPFRSLAADEATAIISLMRLADASRLSLVEQAYLIDELRSAHNLTVTEIAGRLDKSPAWVSARLGLTTELTPLVSEKIMSGAFPMHAYLASVRPLTRVNKVQGPEIDAFVRATSGKGLSVRDLDCLAKGYFQGGDDFRRHVQDGDVRWCLGALRPTGGGGGAAAANEGERRVLADLEIAHRKIRRLLTQLQSQATYSQAFLAEANLLCGALQRWMPSFSKIIKDFYARTRPEDNDCSPSPSGHEQA